MPGILSGKNATDWALSSPRLCFDFNEFSGVGHFSTKKIRKKDPNNQRCFTNVLENIWLKKKV